MRARLCILLLAASAMARAAGHEFEDVAKAIESHYGVARTHIPFLGVADLVLKVGHPAGASGFHLALFQNIQSDLDDEHQEELDRFMDTIPSPALHRVIRARSRAEGDATYIFCGDTGKITQVLVVTFNRKQATVVEVKIAFDTLLRWLQHPEEAGKSLQPD